MKNRLYFLNGILIKTIVSSVKRYVKIALVCVKLLLGAIEIFIELYKSDFA